MPEVPAPPSQGRAQSPCRKAGASGLGPPPRDGLYAPRPPPAIRPARAPGLHAWACRRRKARRPGARAPPRARSGRPTFNTVTATRGPAAQRVRARHVPKRPAPRARCARPLRICNEAQSTPPQQPRRLRGPGKHHTAGPRRATNAPARSPACMHACTFVGEGAPGVFFNAARTPSCPPLHLRRGCACAPVKPLAACPARLYD